MQRASPYVTLLTCAVALLWAALAQGHETGAFVRAEGTHFRHGAQRLYFAGANCYYLPWFAGDTNAATGGQTWRDMADEVMERCELMGLRVLRVWAFNETLTSTDFSAPHGDWRFRTGYGAYREEALRGLDYVMARADELDLFVVLTLVNNWDDYGGMAWYVANSPASPSGHDSFYTDAACRQEFKRHAATLAGRTNTLTGRVYRDDPALFAWQLANEPRCQSDTTGLTVRNWVYEMAAYIQAIDTNHMVSTGEEGWTASQPWEGTRWHLNSACPDVDYAVLHCWPDWWWPSATESARYSNAMAWVSSHVADAQALGKPVVLSEFGRLRPPAGPPLDSAYGRNAYFQGWFGIVSGSAATNGPAAGLAVWMIEADNSGHDDGVGSVFSWDTSTILLLADQAETMNTLIAPSLLEAAPGGGGLSLRWTPVVGNPGYEVQGAADVGAWTSLVTVATNRWTDSSAGPHARRFYRIRPVY